MEKKKRALVLEGGGAKGSYQIGAYEYLKEQKLGFDYVVGASVGSINAAVIVQDDIDLAKDLWTSIEFSDLVKIGSDLQEEFRKEGISLSKLKAGIEFLLRLIKNRGLNIEPLYQLLSHYIDEEEIRNAASTFGLITINQTDDVVEKLFIDDMPRGDLAKYILASSYLRVFKQVPINGKTYLDGGFAENIPISMVEDFVDEIYVIGLYKHLLSYKDIEGHPKVLTYIRPRQSLGGMLNFSPSQARINIELGYEDAERNLQI